MNTDLDLLFQLSSDDCFFSQIHENSMSPKQDDQSSVFSVCPSVSTDNFNNFFGIYPPASEVDPTNHLYLENGNVDNFILNMQIKLKSVYFEYDFSRILNILDSQFPCFFGEINYPFLYTIQKLRFFRLLQIGKEIEINSFYFDTLLRLLKEVKPTEWKNKNKFFIKLIKKKDIFKKRNILEKYYEQFQFELDKAIRNYLSVKEGSPTQLSNDTAISSGKNLPETHKKENVFNVINTNYDINNYVANNDHDVELEDMSTKVEFSDFEDEFNYKFCDDNEQNNNNNQGIDQRNNVVDHIFPLNTLDIANISGITSDNNIRVINPSIISEKDKEKTACSVKTKKKSSVNTKSEQTLFNQLPFLSSFKPKYAKRETIDKKIIRHFRQFIINQNKLKKFTIDNSMKDYSFYILLINGNLLPPLDFFDNTSNEKIVFKSFNSNYLLWFFSKQGIKDLYVKFTSTVGLALIEEISNYYELCEKEKKQLENYVNNLPFIFDISLINKITENEGYHCGHLYRKNRNASKKNVVIHLNRNRKERSRETDKNENAFNTSCNSEE